MKKNKFIVSGLLFILLTSCRSSNTLPENIESRIFGSWVMKPIKSKYPSGRVFNLVKYDTIQHDSCNILRFAEPKEFYWHYLNKSDNTNFLSCGNTLRPSEQSTWNFEKNSIILVKKWTAIQESKTQKLKYFIYEFSPDTFTLVLDTILLNDFSSNKRSYYFWRH